MNSSAFKKRSGIILTLLLLWGILAAVQMVYYSYWNRERLLEESRYLAWREGEIPAMRGTICDRSGIKLAWTELSHDLILSKRDLKPERCTQLFAELGKIFEKPLPAEEEKEQILLKRNLSPGEILKLKTLLQRYPELEIAPNPRRLSLDYPEIREQIGRTGNRNGREQGISGWEAQYEQELSGTPGVFRVMLDRKGAWVPGTIEILRQPIPGKDVRVPLSVREVRKE